MAALDGGHDPGRLAAAIRATFARRRTPIPETFPDALTEAFARDPAKQRQWAAFAADIADSPDDLAVVVAALARFAEPLLTAARMGD